MVFVNSKKFACESCIKGHRSSACHHTDRPLFEVKKKGRPVSQCEKCRGLRQSRRVHSKCNCNSSEGSSTSKPETSAAPRTKQRRFVPIAPALPNGIRDVFRASQHIPSAPTNSRQRVDSLLNPCTCKSLRECRCRELDTSGLTSLAQAAALTLETNSESSMASSSSCCHPPKQVQNTNSNALGPELPPVLFSYSTPTPSSDTIPMFDTMPSMSEITSLAGSGCTCGVECSCPGCVEHRGAENAAPDRPSCAHGCGTCVDNRHDRTLSAHEPTSTMIDRFLARAAALPAPPPNRKMGVGAQLDPMNVMMYPPAAMESREQGIPFGLINIPKLKCCGGRCGCPSGQCGCGKSCDGCCAEHSHQTQSQAPTSTPVGSCCSGS